MSGQSQKSNSRSTLHSGQIAILELLYKYRFSSRQLLAESLGIKAGSSLHEKLVVLTKHGYMDMRLEKRLKLIGTPAAYYLLPKSLRALQALPAHEYITNAAIKASYKDKTVSQDFITHTLNVHKYTNILLRHYSDMKVFTRRIMSQYDYFPSQLPDAFLSLPTANPKQPKRFFLDIISDATPRYIVDRRIANYCQFFDEGGWDATGSALPSLLLVSEWGPAEKRIQRSVRTQLGRSDMEELQAYTTTTGALDIMSDERAIWTSVEDTEELLELASLTITP